MEPAEWELSIDFGVLADDWVMRGFVAARMLADLGDDVAEDVADVVLTGGAAADVPGLPDEVRMHVITKEWWT